ncbi:DUF4192 domain-containing protein [Nocardioides dongxiaopingii]|uniref:DUF4192 domain-containing protein n=1 Tax=Nocardioides dongxiaopingii TaxID=2576036 RepID=UPI001485C0BB|nr:DUF4192 domain-containing protein [Nocardioides dongxiaopingii]
MTPKPSQPPTPSTGATRTTLTARTPEDLLAAAAVVLGFWPTESVVLLTLDARHRFHARVDLPPPDDPAALAEVADSLLRPATRHGAGRVVLLVYTDDARAAAAAWTALREAFARSPVVVVEAVRVAAARWYPLLARDPALRTAGVAYSTDALATHPFLAHAVLDGRVTHGSRGDLAATLAPDPAGVAAVAALLAPAHDDPAHDDPSGDDPAEDAWAEVLVRTHLDAGTCCSDPEAARLLRGMQSRRVRDAAWSGIAPGRARAAVVLLSDLVRRSPPHLRSAPAALLGWAAWQAGDGALAWCAVDRCREVDPGCTLADLVAEALERAVPPTAWSASARDPGRGEGLDSA